jgi:hypothetical protein
VLFDRRHGTQFRSEVGDTPGASRLSTSKATKLGSSIARAVVDAIGAPQFDGVEHAFRAARLPRVHAAFQARRPGVPEGLGKARPGAPSRRLFAVDRVGPAAPGR